MSQTDPAQTIDAGRHLLSALLVVAASGVPCRENGAIEAIPIDRVLYTAWHADSLDAARQALQERRSEPPIRVTEFRLGPPTHGRYYTVSDGHHRAAARAEAGKTKVKAQIDGIVEVDFTQLVVYRKFLWRRATTEDGFEELRLLTDRLPEDALQLAVRYGAEMRDVPFTRLESIGGAQDA